MFMYHLWPYACNLYLPAKNTYSSLFTLKCAVQLAKYNKRSIIH